MFAQVCMRLDVAYIVGTLGRYLSNPGLDHKKAMRRVILYLQRTKDFMLTYQRYDHLEVIGYSNFEFSRCLDSRRHFSLYLRSIDCIANLNQ